MRALLALSLAAGCRYTGTFECATDDQCRHGSDTGTCTSGYCAFGDGACLSMLRYDETAGPDLAGQCVPAARRCFGDRNRRAESADAVTQSRLRPHARGRGFFASRSRASRMSVRAASASSSAACAFAFDVA